MESYPAEILPVLSRMKGLPLVSCMQYFISPSIECFHNRITLLTLLSACDLLQLLDSPLQNYWIDSPSGEINVMQCVHAHKHSG